MTSDTRSVNTQTPLGDTLSSDDGSQSTSPDEGAAVSSASPRINKFLAREPPDGCEKVRMVWLKVCMPITQEFRIGNFKL